MDSQYIEKKKEDVELDDIALAVLSGDKYVDSRVSQLMATWVRIFPNFLVFADTDGSEDYDYIRACCPSNIFHTLGTTQYKWKYIPFILFKKFPNAQYYFIVDDDTYIFPEIILRFLHEGEDAPKPSDLVVVVPSSASFTRPWSTRQCKTIRGALKQKVPGCEEFFLIPGGIMLFTHDLFKELAQPVTILQCQDDLAVLDGNLAYPFGGRYSVDGEKDGERKVNYNQDHLFSWCVQVRLQGTILKKEMFWFFGGNVPKGFLRNIIRTRFGYTEEVLFDEEGKLYYNCNVEMFRKHNLGGVHQMKKKSAVAWVHRHCGFEKYYKDHPDYKYMQQYIINLDEFFQNNHTKIDHILKKQEKRKHAEELEELKKEEEEEEVKSKNLIESSDEKYEPEMDGTKDEDQNASMSELLGPKELTMLMEEIKYKIGTLELLFQRSETGQELSTQVIIRSIGYKKEDFINKWMFLFLSQIVDEDFFNWFPNVGVREKSLTDDMETRILMKKIWARLKTKLKNKKNPFGEWLLKSFPEFEDNAETLQK